MPDVQLDGIEEALVSYLRSLGDLAALIADRIYPERAPRDAPYPRLVYTVLTSPRLRVLDPPSGLAGMGQPTFQLDAYAQTYAQAKTVARAVRGTLANPRLDGFTGWMGGANSGFYVQSAEITDMADHYEAPQDASDTAVYRVRMDLALSYDER